MYTCGLTFDIHYCDDENDCCIFYDKKKLNQYNMCVWKISQMKCLTAHKNNKLEEIFLC